MEEPEYKETPYRFVIATLFILASVQNAIVWITASPILNQLQNIYSASTLEISMATTMAIIVYTPVNFPSNYILDSWGIKKGFLIGAGFTLAGGWFRVLCKDGYGWVLVGNLLAGIGQPFIMNAPAKVAAYWFKPESRAMATTMMSIFNVVGVGIGFLIPGFFLTGNSSDVNDVFWLMMFEAILGTVFIVPSFFLFKGKPKVPPSYAAEVHKVPFKRAMNLIFRKNRNFLKLLFFFSMTLGNYNSLATVIAAIIKPFGFTDDDSAVLGASVIGSGIFGAVLFGAIVSVKPVYKHLQIICGIAAFFSVCFIGIALWLEKFYLGIIACVLFGFFNTPTIPLSLELGCEITFPVGEALSSGVLFTGGQFVGLILLFLFNGVFDQNSKAYVYGFIGLCAGLTLLGTILIATMEERLRRTRQEIRHESFRKSRASNISGHSSFHSHHYSKKAMSYSENDEDEFYKVEQSLLEEETENNH